MTKKILMGLFATAILFTLGTSAQSFAEPADKTQSEILATTVTGNLALNGQQYELVGIPPITKGAHTTYQLVLKPIELPDSTPLPKLADPHPLMLVGIPPTTSGGHVDYQLVPRPDPNPKDFVS